MTSEVKIIIDTILEEESYWLLENNTRLCSDHNFTGTYKTVCTYVKQAKEKMQNKRKTIAETFERLKYTGGETQINFCIL